MFMKAVFVVLGATLCAALINNPAIFRPCDLNNMPCIENSLRSSSRCQPARGSVPSEYIVPRARFDTATFNASYEDIDLIIRGLERCFVSEYYVNRNTRVHLLAMDCPWLTFESTRIMYQHYLRQEDGVFRYYINGSYPLITVTVPLTRPDLDLCQEYPNTHVHQLPIFKINPLDRPTQNHLTRDLGSLGVYERETFAARAQLLARVIINNKLCDFGCN